MVRGMHTRFARSSDGAGRGCHCRWPGSNGDMWFSWMLQRLLGTCGMPAANSRLAIRSLEAVLGDSAATPRERLWRAIVPCSRVGSQRHHWPDRLHRRFRSLEDRLLVASLDDGGDGLCDERVSDLLIDLHLFATECRQLAWRSPQRQDRRAAGAVPGQPAQRSTWDESRVAS